METVEHLKKKIGTAQEVQSVVRTMKVLAAVSIRQYERAVESLGEYDRTVLLGLQTALKRRPRQPMPRRRHQQPRLGAVVFGSDQGMCGQLNDQIVSHALKEMDTLGGAPASRTILAVGERARARLEGAGQTVDEVLSVPGSPAGITSGVQEVLVRIEDWTAARGIERVTFFYSEQLSGASYRAQTLHLLPVDEAWLAKIEQNKWPTHVLPKFTMPWGQLFSALIRQYLFVSLYRAFAESLASENASRLASMQNAERNIQERLVQLRSRFHRQRQMTITEELLDIVSGFEALKDQ